MRWACAFAISSMRWACARARPSTPAPSAASCGSPWEAVVAGVAAPVPPASWESCSCSTAFILPMRDSQLSIAACVFATPSRSRSTGAELLDMSVCFREVTSAAWPCSASRSLSTSDFSSRSRFALSSASRSSSSSPGVGLPLSVSSRRTVARSSCSLTVILLMTSSSSTFLLFSVIARSSNSSSVNEDFWDLFISSLSASSLAMHSFCCTVSSASCSVRTRCSCHSAIRLRLSSFSRVRSPILASSCAMRFA
mmetsp:Transcript_24/g.79  ORF Transcript_24/g.79 Transcript_24/m.79 type:complete len:253 (+) Transcript_24:749-1507(+)